MGDATDGAEAVVGLDLTGPLALQGWEAAAGLRLWADATEVNLRIIDLNRSKDSVVRMYASWVRSGTDMVLLPYGSGRVRAVLSGVGMTGGRLMWNHGGSDDELARRWAPMVLVPASSYFVPLVDLAARRGCRSVAVAKGSGGFAARVSDGAVVRAEQLGLRTDVRPLAGTDIRRLGQEEALLVVGRFEDDVAVIAGLKWLPRLTGCVAAGIPAFGKELGTKADGVLGPAQWRPDTAVPELGPSGSQFSERYRERFGKQPSYVAAQAAAAGYLASAATRRSLTTAEIDKWSTSTLLGDFEVDEDGRQVGHSVTVVGWEQGRMVPVT